MTTPFIEQLAGEIADPNQSGFNKAERVVLMTAPILLPIIVQAGFDPYWFAVVLTVNMQIGLITPPVGLNLYVIDDIAPKISLRHVLRGPVPYVRCMIVGIILLCLFPGIAIWFPTYLMGPTI